MTHIVIGGEGFTGSVLTKKLLDLGEEVLSIDLIYNKKRDARARFEQADITIYEKLQSIPLGEGDIVYHLAARQYHNALPYGAKKRLQFFNHVNVGGTRNILEWMKRTKARRLVYFSSDMVYGIPDQTPVPTSHPRRPLGPYGLSKAESENLCIQFRSDGAAVSIFRPRMIVGPGRFGILTKLFELISRSLPVPMIGRGHNAYQMVSVFDCADAAIQAWRKNIPNQEFNLGSKNPPPIAHLLQGLIESASSKSKLISTPAPLIKKMLGCLDAVGIRLMVKEQFGIADINYSVDISSCESVLDWQPLFNDEAMITQAYHHWLKGKSM